MVGNKNKEHSKPKPLSLFLTLLIVFLLIFSGPATAANVNLSADKAVVQGAGTSDAITFYADVSFATSQEQPLYNTLNLTGASTRGWTVGANGAVTGGELYTGEITVSFNNITTCGGFGYGYGYGFGYGECNETRNYNITLNTSLLPAGNYTARFYVYTNISSYNSPPFNFVVQDVIPPSITISAPAKVQRLTAANLTITIYDLQPGYKQISENGTPVAAPMSYAAYNGISFNYSINTSTAGILNYTVWANDSVGNANSASALVEITPYEANPPVITITNPVNGSTINIFNQTVSGSVSDESVLKNITLYLNSVFNYAWTTNGSFVRTVNYSVGANTINITAVDIYNNTANKVITVNVAPPLANVTINATANITNVVDAVVNTSTYIEFNPTVNGNVTITINVSTNGSSLATQLNGSAVDFSAYAVAQGYSSINQFIKIDVSGAVNESTNLSSVLIRAYYSDAQLDKNGDGDANDPGDINPTSLKLWRYCPAQNKWDVVNKGSGQIKCGSDTIDVFDSGVNTTAKFVYANLSHFSVYGIGGSIAGAPGAPSETGDGWPGLYIPAKPKVTVVANAIDKALAEDFFGFLKNAGIDVTIVSAVEFESVKTGKFLIILGGPDAPEGIGDIVKQLIDENEQNSLRVKGNRKMYTITNKYAAGQVIHILAGSDRSETKNAHTENKQSVSAKIKG